MASTTAFNSLSVPAPDDNMEMSSPANRNLDDDIDIDFDDYTGGVNVADDEQMIEAGDPTRPGTGTDDLMEDDVLPGEQAITEEEVMQDDGIQVQEEDEELIDYGEDEIHDLPLDDTVIPEANEAAGAGEVVSDEVDEEVTRVPGVAIPDIPTSEILDDVTAGVTHVQDPIIDTAELFDPLEQAEDGVHIEADAPLSGQSIAVETTDEHANLTSADQPAIEEDLSRAPISLNTALSVQTDTPGTPTDTGLHAMNIRYGDLRMPLFKSKRQLDGLLKDDNLASLSLAELIRNCRQRLAIRIGEDISEDQEIVLGFEHLGLMLVEDSRSAFESSLNDVLEVYLQLHRNDAVDEIPPLSLTLSLQLKFASSFSMLKQAAAGGQGMSTFGFLQPAAEEDYYHEELEDGDEGAEHQFGEQYDETTESEHTDEAGLQNLTEGYGIEHPGGELGHFEEAHFFEEHEEYHQDTAEDPYAQDQDQAPSGLEVLLQGEHQVTDTTDNALDDAAAAGKDSLEEDTVQHLDAALGTTNDITSRASSTTVQGDNLNANSTRATDGNDDFSTFLTEFEAEEHSAAPKAGDFDASKEDTSAQHVLELLEGEHADPTYDAQYLGSEDFLNDLGENEEHGDHDYDGEQGEEGANEPGEDQEQFEEEQYDQANTYGEQQDEYHPDYEPGEDDEQFHTANQDFFSGEYYEHGPEHDVYDAEEDGLDDTINTVVHHLVEYEEGDTQEDFEDDLGFDDGETYEQQVDGGTAVKAVQPGSPVGNKRSFDEHADEDDLEFEEREVKKSRAS